MKTLHTILLLTCLCVFAVNLQPALCWSNGGYSADLDNPDYGTHDWIAQHALDHLPAGEKQYLTDNLEVYLYGTELPDNGQAADGIGDTTKHHIYYSAQGSVTDDMSANRAQAQYDAALTYLKEGNYKEAAKAAGAMTHYIVDVAVFGHVMGKSTAWGEETHHSDYEGHVDDNTGSYQSTYSSFLVYDGSLSCISAYNATLNVAYNTVFDDGSTYGCVWMDDNYNWSSTTFNNRCGESLNLAVNAVADVLHTLYLAANPSSTVAPTASPIGTPMPTAPEYPAASLLVLFGLATLASTLFYKKGKIKKTNSC